MGGPPGRTLRLPILYGLTDPRGGRSHAECAALLAAAGVRLVQVRDKAASSRDRLASARAAVDALHRAGAIAVVNDRVDVALLSGADGVHLGEDDLPADAARALLAPGALVGVSTHAVETARAAMDDPAASYVALGPVFGTRSKETPHLPLGLGAVEAAARGRTRPLVVIGGIEPARVGDCLSAGADCVAMIAGLLDGDVRRNVEAALASAARAGFA